MIGCRSTRAVVSAERDPGGGEPGLGLDIESRDLIGPPRNAAPARAPCAHVASHDGLDAPWSPRTGRAIGSVTTRLDTAWHGRLFGAPLCHGQDHPDGAIQA